MPVFQSVLFCVLVLSSCATGSLLDEILTAAGNTFDCVSCHGLLVPLQALALLGNSAFVGVLVTLCETFKVGTAAHHLHLIDRLLICKARG